MKQTGQKYGTWIARHRDLRLVSYGIATLAVWVALSLWTFSPLLHRHPFALFLAAVLFTARFLGFGPAVFASLLSAACLDFFVLSPVFSFGVEQSMDAERIVVFVALSVFAGSMARQKSLAESRADRLSREWAAIFEYSCDAIFSATPEGIITSWNRAAEQLYGYTSQEAVGSPVTMLAPPERAREVDRNRQILNSGGQVSPYQTERMRKDGSRWPVLLTISPLRDAGGRIVGASAIARDMSTEKLSQEALRRSDKLATTGQMAATIAHEINNPLEAVSNLLYLARNDSSNAPGYLTMAEQEISRIGHIAQQTLGFVKETQLPEPVNPAAIMDEILQLYARNLENRKIQVMRRYRDAGPVHGFGGELRQLFANLIVNAADAMTGAGTLRVRVAAGRAWSSGRYGVRVTVADNGAGIPRDTLARIFEPFYTTKDSGTGLGLWVSNGIVRKHGGTIRVRSRVEGSHTGTVFSIFLPHQYEERRAEVA